MKKIRTLLIGGSGYLGSNLVPELIAMGRHVTILGRSVYPKYNLPLEVKYVTGSYTQRDFLRRLLDQQEEVIHLAYSTIPNTSFEDPLADLLENLPSSIQLFTEVSLRGIKLILVSSGGTVYGNAQTFPIKENHLTNPISPYGVTKLTIEKYANLYSVTHNLKYLCLRPSNVYGYNQPAFKGQGFIATAIASIITNKPIKIFGKNGSIRDYIHISDLVSGIVGALLKGHYSETYNIGSGVGASNLDIINKILEIIGKDAYKVSVENLPERLFDVKSNILDCSKLNNHTGWSPNINLDQGLRSTIQFLQSLPEYHY
jgi:UDP-glucose 4-epimerase